MSVTSDNWIAHVLIGEALGNVGETDAAISHLEQATRLQPTSPQAWHNLGYAYAQAALNESAEDAYRRAIALRPDFAPNHYNLGLLLEAAGRTDDARAALQDAIDCAERAGETALAAQARGALADLSDS